MKISENILLAPYTTFKIGGRARYFCTVKNEEELRQALDFARRNSLRFFILGGGSNILISDSGFDGLVIKMEIKGMVFEKVGENVLVTAWAGEGWDRLVAETVRRGLWGLENLSAIPGTVGAAPMQNIGAYGAEIKNTAVKLRALDSTGGSIKILKNTDCLFSYRESFFKTEEGKKYIITSVTFKLSKVPKPNLSYKDLKEFFKQNKKPSLSEIRRAVIAIRKGKFPDLSAVGTVGSFWKNPIVSKKRFEKLQKKYRNIPSFPENGQVKVPLAWILDKICNLKDLTAGSVGLWRNQPIVIIAKKGAKVSEINTLEKKVSKKVKEMTSIVIEKEVQYVE